MNICFIPAVQFKGESKEMGKRDTISGRRENRGIMIKDLVRDVIAIERIINSNNNEVNNF